MSRADDAGVTEAGPSRTAAGGPERAIPAPPSLPARPREPIAPGPDGKLLALRTVGFSREAQRKDDWSAR
jgi:hypothetical protein